MTVELWVKLNRLDHSPRIAGQLGGGGNTGLNKWLLGYRDDRGHVIYISLWPTSGAITDVFSNVPILDFNWHQIAFTFDGGHALKLYQDGVLVGSAITDNPWPSTNTTTEFAASEGGGDLDGMIQLMRVSAGVRTSFPSGAFARILTEPLSAVGGVEQIPDVLPTLPPTPTFTPTATGTPSPFPWCAVGYASRIELTVNAQVNTPAGYPVKADVNAITNNFQSDGRDLRVFYWNGSACVQLDRDYIAKSSQVWFPLQTALSGTQTDNRYFLYFNDPNESNIGPSDPNNVYNWPGRNGNTQLLYHFPENPIKYADGSVNHFNATLGSGITRPLGQFGRGVQFINNNTGLVTASTGPMGLGSGITVEGWGKSQLRR